LFDFTQLTTDFINLRWGRLACESRSTLSILSKWAYQNLVCLPIRPSLRLSIVIHA